MNASFNSMHIQSMLHSIQCIYSVLCSIQFNAYSVQCPIQFNAYSIQYFIQFNASFNSLLHSIQCFIQFNAPFNSMVDQVSLSRTNLRESGNENVKDVRRHIEISPVLAPLSVTQHSALAERGSRDNCLRMLIVLASFLANRYCACTTRQDE